MSTDPDRTVKIIVVGNVGVGKTSLLYRFCQQTFQDTFTSTIGFDFNYKTLDIDGKKIKLQIWDTGGQERCMMSPPPSYFRDAEGAIPTYSIHDRESFENIVFWMNQVNNLGGRNARKILVGNKMDDEAGRVVSYQEGRTFADHHQMQFFETSAKEDVNVTEAFYGLARDIKETILDGEVNIPVNTNVRINSDTKKTTGCWEWFLNLFKFS